MNRRSLLSLLSFLGIGAAGSAAVAGGDGESAALSVSEMRARELAPRKQMFYEDASDIVDVDLFRDTIWTSERIYSVKRWPSHNGSDTVFEVKFIKPDGALGKPRRYRMTPTQIDHLRREDSDQLVFEFRRYGANNITSHTMARYKRAWGVEWSPPETT